jgi:hypothetical protein
MTDLKDVARIAAADHNLAVVATTRADGSVQASVVNAGITDHPLSAVPPSSSAPWAVRAYGCRSSVTRCSVRRHGARRATVAGVLLSTVAAEEERRTVVSWRSARCLVVFLLRVRQLSWPFSGSNPSGASASKRANCTDAPAN